jgi:hypothetical protein
MEETMSKPVFKLYLMKLKLEAVVMPEEQQQALMGKTQDVLAQAGGKSLIAGQIWSDEHYRYFGVEQFPDWQALREHTRCLDEMNWFQYIESETLVGLENPDNPTRQEPLLLASGTEEPFFLIYLARFNDEFEITEAVMKEAEQVNQLMKELGIIDMISVNARIGNEAWGMFGIQLIPSMDALEKKQAAQAKAKWWKYIEARTYLGSASDGELIKRS